MVLRYVDNGVLRASRELVTRSMNELCDAFERDNLLIHDREIASGARTALGVKLDVDAMRTRATPKRFWRTRAAVIHVLTLKNTDGICLESLVGHATFLALVSRELLSCFRTCYRLIRSHRLGRAPMWDSVRAELDCFVGGMIYLEASWNLRWNNVVYASDASLTGFVICTSRWSAQDVRAIGRRSERSRFRAAQVVSARASPLAFHEFESKCAETGWGRNCRKACRRSLVSQRSP